MDHFHSWFLIDFLDLILAVDRLSTNENACYNRHYVILRRVIDRAIGRLRDHVLRRPYRQRPMTRRVRVSRGVYRGADWLLCLVGMCALYAEISAVIFSKFFGFVCLLKPTSVILPTHEFGLYYKLCLWLGRFFTSDNLFSHDRQQTPVRFGILWWWARVYKITFDSIKLHNTRFVRFLGNGQFFEVLEWSFLDVSCTKLLPDFSTVTENLVRIRLPHLAVC